MLLLSKLLNLLAQPLNWVLVVLLAAVLLQRRRPRLAHRASVAALSLLALMGVQTWPDALISQLENQSAEMAPNADLSGYAGIIILGGALESGRMSQAHQQPLLNSSAERMTMAVALWRRFPKLQLVFTGGEGEFFGTGPTEAERAKQFFDSMGVPAEAVRFESRSRNTYENAVFTRDLPGMDARKPWLLMTSAWHMPRSLAVFQKAGVNVTSYPVDFRTGGSTPWTNYSLSNGTEQWELLLHEWLGMAAYRLSGRI